MKSYIEERCQAIAYYMIKHRCTVRDAAKVFKIGKTTVHRDISKCLKDVNYQLYLQCQELIIYNKSIRSIRGGKASKQRRKHI